MTKRPYPVVHLTQQDLEQLEVYRHNVELMGLGTKEDKDWTVFDEGKDPLSALRPGLLDLLLHASRFSVEIEAVLSSPPSRNWRLSTNYMKLQRALQHVAELRVTLSEATLHTQAIHRSLGELTP